MTLTRSGTDDDIARDGVETLYFVTRSETRSAPTILIALAVPTTPGDAADDGDAETANCAASSKLANMTAKRFTTGPRSRRVQDTLRMRGTIGHDRDSRES